MSRIQQKWQGKCPRIKSHWKSESENNTDSEVNNDENLHNLEVFTQTKSTRHRKILR